MAYRQAIYLMMELIYNQHLQRIPMARITMFTTREGQPGRNTRDQVSESTFGSFLKFY